MKNNQVLVLYGSTGDLTFRKIIPSLINLEENKLLNNDFKVIAVGRRDFNCEEYLNFIKENNSSINIDIIKKRIEYFKMEITVKEDFLKLKDYIEAISTPNARIIHFLAIAPEFMTSMVSNLIESKLVVKNNVNHSIIFEKPFGNNLIEAIKLNNMLEKRLSEKQVFRIDHYLGKDIFEKIMYYRFESNLFASFFDENNLDKIDIVLKEKEGILNRGSYFDNSGTVKDMFQGHILQIITLLTISKPVNFKEKNFTKEKMKVLRKLKFDKGSLVFGQYNNYLEEKNVKESSQTETMFEGKFYVKNNFRNIPINVFVGKKMDVKESYIKLTLKDNSEFMISMYPNNEITIKSELKYNKIFYNLKFDLELMDYAKIIIGALEHNKNLFVSNEEVVLSWKITEEVLKQKEELIIYNNN